MFMAVCPNCGEENPDRFRFCGVCATRLRSHSAPPEEARKTVTVVFCDLVASTALGERLDPESLREVMDRYFTEMRGVLERHGGIVEKYIGDAIMAIFGLPRAHEDDALRAVRAAFEMGQALLSLNIELERVWGVNLSNRTGVNTGGVVVGDATSGQRLATGDAVNVAARLEQAAPVGQVLIGSSTHRLIKDAVTVNAVEPLVLKGKSDPIPAFLLIDVSQDAFDVARHFDAPIVGREEEMSSLLEAFNQSLEDRTCLLVTVLGDAGVGKSRLVAEILHRLRPWAQVLCGRCLSYGEGITFWPLAEILKESAEIDDYDSRATARTKVASMLAGEDEADAISERLASAMGLASTPFPIEETFWASRKSLEVLARRRPLVILIEDIHWAQPTFLDLLEHVVDVTNDASILVVCPARRELLEARPEWMQGKANASTVTLRALTRDPSNLLIDNLLGPGLDYDARSRITAAAQGNPLFIEQIVSMWTEDGRLSRADQRWVFTEDLDSVEIPPTISALLSARLDRLAQEERTVIAGASVVGQVFYQGAVEELSPSQLGTQVPALLAALTTKEFIRPDSSTFADEQAFAFRHVLIRDIAYEAMLKRTRASLHERFASWLEGVTGDRIGEYEEIVGYHLEQAYRYRERLGPIEDQERTLSARASRYLSSAGRKAFVGADMPSAAKLLGRAASLLPIGEPERGELRIKHATALSHMGELHQGLEVLNQVIQEAATRCNQGLQHAALMERSAMRSRTSGKEGDLDTVIRDAIPAFERTGDESGLARAYKWLSEVHNERNLGQARVEALEQGLQHATAADDLEQIVEILTYLPLALIHSAVPVPAAIRRCRRLLEEPERSNRSIEGYLVAALGYLHGQLGQFEEGRGLLLRAKMIAKELRLPWMLARIAGLRGELETLADNPQIAEQELREGCEILRAMGEKDRYYSLAAFLAEALYRQGRIDEAERLADASFDAGNGVVPTYRVRARIAAKRGRHIEAESLVREAIERVSGAELPNERAAGLMDYAEILQLEGRFEEATQQLDKAMALYSQKGNIVAENKARTVLNQLATKQQLHG
ncbi:AAA family ATPase [soil metagenome]